MINMNYGGATIAENQYRHMSFHPTEGVTRCFLNGIIIETRWNPLLQSYYQTMNGKITSVFKKHFK